MSNRLLDFADYIGGPDTIVVELFPRSQKRYTFNFGANVSGYSFSSDYQTIVLDQVAYDRTTGEPNFTETTVKGYFANVGVVPSGYISVSNTTTGVVSFTVPPSRYTGNIFPNARANVAATVVSFEWQDGANTFTSNKNVVRFLVMERWEPGVKTGDPSQETVQNGGFIALDTAST